MNIANEETINCETFHNHIRAYIDDELPVNIRITFMEHAGKCLSCEQDLREMESVKKLLAGLQHFDVLPEFNFRLKSSIRRELQRSRNPLYPARLFLSEHFYKVLVIPACALAIILGVMYYHAAPVGEITKQEPVEYMSTAPAKEMVDLAAEQDESSVEEVNYILETLTSTDAERGIFLGEEVETIQTLPVNDNLSLVSF